MVPGTLDFMSTACAVPQRPGPIFYCCKKVWKDLGEEHTLQQRFTNS